VAVFDAPGERVETGVEEPAAPPRWYRSTALRRITGLKARPTRTREAARDFGIGLEFQAVGAGSVLVLVDHQRTDAAHAVIAEMPAAAVAIGGARERHPAEDQQIASAIEELLDGGPCVFGKGGAVGKD
jgi:hypothetical protein